MISLRINSVSEEMLFADDTGVIISRRHFGDICWVSNLFLSHVIKWFAASKLVLNLDETKLNLY
jgi:hypothetical protein